MSGNEPIGTARMPTTRLRRLPLPGMELEWMSLNSCSTRPKKGGEGNGGKLDHIIERRARGKSMATVSERKLIDSI